MSDVKITQEFELPIGIEVNGTFHRNVTMRKVKNKDIMAIQQDTRIRELGKDNLQMRQNDPIQAMKVNAALIRLFTTLFCRVIIKIEGLDDVKPPYFEDMYQEDMETMMNVYGELNGVDMKQGGDDPFLRQLGISPGDSPTR